MKRYLLPALWIISLAGAYVIGNRSQTSLTEDSDSTNAQTRSARNSQASSSARSNRSSGSRNARHSGSSSAKQNDRDILSITKDSDPISRVSDLLAMINRLSPGEFEKVVADFRSTGLVRERMSEYAMLLHAWAKVDPLAALDYAEENTGTPFARQTILTSWAAQDPEGALAWAKEHHEGERANPWLVGIIKGIAPTDPKRATEIMSSMPFSRERGEALSALLPFVSNQGTDAALTWISGISDERLRSGATARIAERMANENPEKTAQWLGTIENEETRTRATGEVAEAWARKDIDSAVAWTDSLTGRAKMTAAGEVIGSFARKDAEKAAAWLSSLQGQEGFERVQHSFIWNTARQNPAISLNQVNQLSDERTRHRYYDRILRSWHQNDADAANQWMQSNNIPDSIRERATRQRDDRRRDR